MPTLTFEQELLLETFKEGFDNGSRPLARELDNPWKSESHNGKLWKYGFNCAEMLKRVPTSYVLNIFGITIKITFVCPPIPYRGADWQAYFDGDEPGDNGQMLHGDGATAVEAVKELLERWGESRK